LLQTLIVPEWRQLEQPADVSLQSIGFAGRQTDASQRQRQPRIFTDQTWEKDESNIHHRDTERTEENQAKSKGNHGFTRIARIRLGKKSKATADFAEDAANCGDVVERLSRLFLVDVLLEFDTWSELGDFAGGDLDDASRLRVASVAGPAVRDGKRSETDERHAIALLQGERDGVNQGIDGGGSAGFGDPSGRRNFLNQIPLIHDGSSIGGY
jgi:hypothetical protein